MKIIPLINEITNSFNETFKNNLNHNLNPFNLESKIRDVGDLFTLKLYESFLNYLDEQLKKKQTKKINIQY